MAANKIKTNYQLTKLQQQKDQELQRMDRFTFEYNSVKQIQSNQCLVVLNCTSREALLQEFTQLKTHRISDEDYNDSTIIKDDQQIDYSDDWQTPGNGFHFDELNGKFLL
jgi:hypothetical protein